MSIKLFLFFFLFVKITNSQYYGLPPNPYQPYNYYSPGPSPLPQPSYASAPTPAYPQPVAPPSPYSSSIPTASQLPTYTPSTLPPVPSYWPPIYSPSPSYPTFPPTVPSAYQPVPTMPTVPKYSPNVASNPTPKFAPIRAAPKCQPSTATAYYLTTVQEAPKAAVMKEKVKESTIEKQLPPPAYHCPFCTGFAKIPRNPKVPPPPPCSSVLPGILDKIPSITLPEELKLKSLSKLAPPPTLLSDLLEHKLSGKLRFDEDLLDGFLTGLGMGNCCK